jgi:hypothetical protein
MDDECEMEFQIPVDPDAYGDTPAPAEQGDWG